MSRKLEYFSIPELVAMFALKWNLEMYQPINKSIMKLPYILYDNNEYRVYFKGALSPTTWEKLTKKVLIHPDKHLNKYQLNQLVAATKGEFNECGD